MRIDDQIRTIENRLTALEKDRTALLTELKELRAQRDQKKPAMLLGRPSLMKAPESNKVNATIFMRNGKVLQEIMKLTKQANTNSLLGQWFVKMATHWPC